MLKRKQKLSASHWCSVLVVIVLASAALTGCDRGASEQIQAAEKFADAMARNNVPLRDSLIATPLLKSQFQNAYVASDLISWMQIIYDIKNNKFASTTRVDVDHDLKPDLINHLFDNAAEIEATGMVRVRSPLENDQSAYFWMVKQKGAHWKVAMVTKGEMQVDFNR